MKKLIALSAAAVLASSAAMASVSLSGTASVTYADNGDLDSDTSTGATLTIAGVNGGTSATATLDLTDGTLHSVSMSTSIGPVAVEVDMIDEDGVDTNTVTLSIDVLAGDINISLDDGGGVTITSTVAGIAITHVVGGDTSAVASLAGMDIEVSTDGTWLVSTTLNGVTLSITDAGVVTASLGLAGNTVEITNDGDTTITVTRDLTSGATLEVSYDTFDDALTLTASVSF